MLIRKDRLWFKYIECKKRFRDIRQNKTKKLWCYLNKRTQLISRFKRQTLEIIKQITSDRARYLKDTTKPGMYILKQQFHRYYSTFNQSIHKSTQELENKQEKLTGKHTSEIHFSNVIMFCKSVNYTLEKRCCKVLMV